MCRMHLADTKCIIIYVGVLKDHRELCIHSDVLLSSPSAKMAWNSMYLHYSYLLLHSTGLFFCGFLVLQGVDCALLTPLTHYTR